MLLSALTLVGLLAAAPSAFAGNASAQLSLPFAKGQPWSANGPHQFDNRHGLRNSVDLTGGDGRVRAATDGMVRYVACGRGHLLMIDHAHGWHTSYYHVTRIRVGNGRHVKRGQWIANTGTATPCGGSAWGRQVHFSLWRYTGRFSWAKVSKESATLDNVDIGGWTIRNGAHNYQGSWTRISNHRTYVNRSGSMGCRCVRSAGLIGSGRR